MMVPSYTGVWSCILEDSFSKNHTELWSPEKEKSSKEMGKIITSNYLFYAIVVVVNNRIGSKSSLFVCYFEILFNYREKYFLLIISKNF